MIAPDVAGCPPPWSLRDPAGVAVVGLDLSLTATGIAYADGTVMTLETGKLRGIERLRVIRQAVRLALDVCDSAPDLVLIEGYAFGRANQAHQLGELGGVVRLALADEHDRYPLMAWGVVPPAAVKKYGSGKGNATKTAMVVAARDRLGYGGTSDDQADALWLRAIGLDLLGAAVVPMPKLNRAALSAVRIECAAEADET